MRLDPKREIYGQPILKIREILRQAMAERLTAKTKIDVVGKISKILGQPKTTAKEVLDLMIKDGYLTAEKKNYAGLFFFEATETEKGRRLGVALANPPIDRDKATLLLQELIERVKSINENEDLAYFVERVRVFGSYLSDKPLLGDLDVAFKLTRRKQGEQFMEMSKKRIALARINGRRFSSFIDELHWPQREVELMLKTKKKGLSLHNEENDDVIGNVINLRKEIGKKVKIAYL